MLMGRTCRQPVVSGDARRGGHGAVFGFCDDRCRHVRLVALARERRVEVDRLRRAHQPTLGQLRRARRACAAGATGTR